MWLKPKGFLLRQVTRTEKDSRKLLFGLNSGAGHEPIAEALQQMWKENLGVEVEILAQEWNVFQQSRKDGVLQYKQKRLDRRLYGSVNFHGHIYKPETVRNNAMYSNPKYDELISAARRETDPAKRIQMYHDAEKILMDDAAIAPLYFYTDPIVISPNLKGVFTFTTWFRNLQMGIF